MCFMTHAEIWEVQWYRKSRVYSEKSREYFSGVGDYEANVLLPIEYPVTPDITRNNVFFHPPR